MRSLAIPIIAMVLVIVTSNILVQYPINDWITWGAFTYPAVFLVADLTNRIFGLRQARIVAIIGFPFGILLSVILSTEADLGLWTSIRIALASGFAFILAQFLDIWIFDKLRKMTWWRAPFISSTFRILEFHFSSYLSVSSIVLNMKFFILLFVPAIPFY